MVTFPQMTDITFHWSRLIQGTYTHRHRHTHTHTHRKKKKGWLYASLNWFCQPKTKTKTKNSLLIMYHFLRLNRSGGKISWLNWKGQFAGSRCHTQSYILWCYALTRLLQEWKMVSQGSQQFLHPQYQIYGLSVRRTSIFASPLPQYHTWGFSVMGILISASPVSHLGLLRDGDSNFCIPSITLGASQ